MNLLLVILDCLRLDSWRREMPRAKKATRGWFHFNNHWGVAHCSDPNISALLCGFGPWETGVTTQMGTAYDKRLPTLTWRWKRAGRGTTWAVMPLLVPTFYRHAVELMAWHAGTDSADLELNAVRRFVAECEPGKPWLGFIRSMTCHYPYLDLPMPPRGEGGEIRPQYEAAVAHEDRFVANLVDFMLAEHPDTVIVVCADHGELLGEHGEYDHLYTLYSILTRTPMAVHVPGLKGGRTGRPTQHVDLAPTLCDLLGLERQGEGVSWAAWMRGEVAHPAPTERALRLQGTGAGPVSEEQLEAKGGRMLDPGLGRTLWRHRGVVRGSYKLVENVHADGAREMALTHSADYKERRTLNGRKVAARMAGLLPAVPEYHDWERAIVATHLRERAAEGDRAVLERLRALGYA